MLQGPTIFKQTVEGTRAGFDSLVNLVQTEAAMFKQNRMLAMQQAQKAAELKMKFEYDVAMEQTKAQIQASAPPSRSAIFQQEMQHSAEMNKMLASNPTVANRLGIQRFESRWVTDENGVGTMLTYIPGADADGKFEAKVIDPNIFRGHFKIFSDAEEALQTINNVTSAGYVNNMLPGYTSSSDLSVLAEALRNTDAKEVALALEQYRRTNIPSVDFVKQNVRSATASEQEVARKVLSAQNRVVTGYNLAGQFLSKPVGATPALNPQDFVDTPVGQIMQNIQARLNVFAGLGENKIKTDEKLRLEYNALKQLQEDLDELLNNYVAVSGSRGGGYNQLYFNDKWNGSDPADIFVNSTQRSALSQPMSTPPGADRDYVNTSSFLFNRLSQ